MLIKKPNMFHSFVNLLFNFNTIALPLGVMWSNLLSPFLLLWLIYHKKITYLIITFTLLLSYMILQYLTFEPKLIKDYFLGAFYFYTSVIVGIFTYYYFNREILGKNQIEKALLSVLYVNITLTVAAIILYFTPLRDIMWHTSTNINSLGEVRLKLLYYEPSHASFVFIFFSLYLLLKTIFFPSKKYLILLVSTAASVFLGKSLGTIGAMFIAMAFGSLIFAVPLIRKYNKQIVLALATGVLIIPLLAGSITSRLEKFLEGGDNSGNVRLIYATLSAYHMVEKYNYYFGVGFGQDKKYITEFTSKFAGYAGNRLPNTFASTLSTVGVFGIALKYLFLLYFFFKTRVYSNIFRLITFFYLLIYSFTGGWMFNVYEFVLWAFAFSQNAFSEFDRRNIFIKKNKMGKGNE